MSRFLLSMGLWIDKKEYDEKKITIEIIINNAIPVRILLKAFIGSES